MPNTTWLKNICGVKLSDDEMKDIPNPSAELITHVTMKDVQAFGLLGSLVIGPISAVVRRGSRNWSGVVRLSRKCGTVGAALGFVAGPAMAMAKIRTLDEGGVYDRCYMLRRNRNQVRVDQLSVVGAAAGAAGGAVMGASVPYGIVLGMTGGVLTAAIYNKHHGDKHT